jgi:molybdopterin synthase catalytic subunit
VLDVFLMRSRFQNFSAGAFVCFEGRVRNHNAGKEVRALEYEAQVSLAEKEGETILKETLTKFDILEAFCAHRTGTLALGDVAVWVGVIAKHRKEAFSACEYTIDAIKHRLPIWKKEHYTDGETAWIHCTTCP